MYMRSNGTILEHRVKHRLFSSSILTRMSNKLHIESRSGLRCSVGRLWRFNNRSMYSFEWATRVRQCCGLSGSSESGTHLNQSEHVIDISMQLMPKSRSCCIVCPLLVAYLVGLLISCFKIGSACHWMATRGLLNQRYQVVQTRKWYNQSVKSTNYSCCRTIDRRRAVVSPRRSCDV